VTDLHFLPTVELCRLLDTGEVSSVELLDHFLRRIGEVDGPINATVALDAERARQRAGEADAARARGERWGPLHGLPMTIKDSFETEGLVTTSGAPVLRDHVPATDAVTVARLKAAGAIVFGKTNLPLYAGDVQTYNEVHGRTNNPWDLDRTCGGSSGGAAAALAAGLTGFELGSDIGGSIRNPAHFCGVFGLKPTWGVVPSRGHIPGPPGTLATADVNVCGPMGRSAADLALGLDVLAGPDAADAVAWRLELPPPRNGGDVTGLRVATWFDDPAVPVAADVRALLDRAAAALADAGAVVAPVDPPVDLATLGRSWLRLVIPVVTAGLPDDAFAALTAAELPPAPSDPGSAAAEDGSVQVLRAMVERHRDWLRANEARQKHRAAFARLFRDHDVLLAPVMPTAAFTHDTEVDIASRTVDVDGTTRPYFDNMIWNGGIGTLLLPVAVPPVGLTPSGLPVGVQVVAPHLEDRTAVAVAAHLEHLLGGFTPPPALR
jgi:amidase